MVENLFRQTITRDCYLRSGVVFTESSFVLAKPDIYGQYRKAFPDDGASYNKPKSAHMVNNKAGMRPKPEKAKVDCGKKVVKNGCARWVPGGKLPCKCKAGCVKKGHCQAIWYDPRPTTTTTTTKKAKTPPAKKPEDIEDTLFDRLDVDNNHALSRKEFQSMDNDSDASNLSDGIAKRVVERLRALFARR